MEAFEHGFDRARDGPLVLGVKVRGPSARATRTFTTAPPLLRGDSADIFTSLPLSMTRSRAPVADDHRIRPHSFGVALLRGWSSLREVPSLTLGPVRIGMTIATFERGVSTLARNPTPSEWTRSA